jgi:hypothetical protein
LVCWAYYFFSFFWSKTKPLCQEELRLFTRVFRCCLCLRRLRRWWTRLGWNREMVSTASGVVKIWSKELLIFSLTDEYLNSLVFRKQQMHKRYIAWDLTWFWWNPVSIWTSHIARILVQIMYDVFVLRYWGWLPLYNLMLHMCHAITVTCNDQEISKKRKSKKPKVCLYCRKKTANCQKYWNEVG